MGRMWALWVWLRGVRAWGLGGAEEAGVVGRFVGYGAWSIWVDWRNVWEQRLGESRGGESEGMSVAGAACIEGEVDTAVPRRRLGLGDLEDSTASITGVLGSQRLRTLVLEVCQSPVAS